MAPSSLAKLMTAEVVFDQLRQKKISLDTEYIVSEHAWRHGGAPSRTSSMFAPIHSKVAVKDLLYGLIIQSANDVQGPYEAQLAGDFGLLAQPLQ